MCEKSRAFVEFLVHSLGEKAEFGGFCLEDRGGLVLERRLLPVEIEIFTQPLDFDRIRETLLNA